MKIQGDLNPSSLCELFKNLSDQRATGILSVYSPMGEKHIALSRGEIAIYSDRLSERTRIGDLLVARGKLTEEKLGEALRLQRNSEKRIQLGALLVEKSFITKDEINEAVKFQLEEEICDLFTYKNASFEFDSARRPEELEGEFSEEDGGQAFVHRLSIDPQALILESSRRIDDWKLFEERLPSPYLCFRVSGKGEDAKAKASPVTQRVLKLLREGRTLETVVKLSCLGRFNAYKTIIRYLDDGWVIPCPASDLRFLASDHRSQERYADALYIYRRLLELSEDETERKEIESNIEDTVEAILRAQAAGRRPEGIEFLSHKGAAAAYKRRQRIFRIFLGAAALVSVVASFWFWLRAQRHDPPPEAYRTAMEQVDVALAEERYEDAIIIWHQFYVIHCDPESDLGKLVHARLDSLYSKYNRQVEFLKAQAEFLEKAGKLDEAEATYSKLKKECPENRYADEIEKALDGLQAKREELRKQATLETWRQKLAAALELEKRKVYDQAREDLLKTSEGAAAGSDVRRQAEEALARIQTVSGRIRDQYQIGLDQLRERQADKALATFDATVSEWPENEWAIKARQQAATLREKQQRIREDVAAAKASEGRGEAAEALQIYERLAKDYPDFQEVQDLAPKMEQLGAKLHNAGDLLAKAQAAEKAGNHDQARDLFGQLLRSHRRFLATQNAAIPMALNSTPTGASVSLGGKSAGKTPLRLEVPADEEFSLKIELPGFATLVKKIRRIEPDDLDATVRLERAAVNVLPLPDPMAGPPSLIEGVLYLSSGQVVMATDPDGAKTRWTSKKIVDEIAAKNLEQERLQIGTQENWWHLQAAPENIGGGNVAVTTPLHEVVALAAANGTSQQLIKLPSEPMGAPGLEGNGIAAGKNLLALVFADGMARVYDCSAPKQPLWEHPIDDAKAPHNIPAAGILPAGAGQFGTVSRGGVLAVWETSQGKKRWSLALETEVVAAFGAPPELRESGSAPAALITGKGTVVAVDLARGQKLWEMPAVQPQERAVAASVGSKGIYVLTRDGMLRRFSRGPAVGNPKADWEKPLDDMGPALDENGRTVFVGTNSQQVYALSADTGKELWRYKCSGRPLSVCVLGKYVYVATSDAKLVILGAE
ncbi:MAG: PQQ-binding-like beta-propeller repeat protein [Planctomycetes bacterium]|nr:PQQ-binding-like beta-propeller repeat protein [Planctomycetota bacterium]